MKLTSEQRDLTVDMLHAQDLIGVVDRLQKTSRQILADLSKLERKNFAGESVSEIPELYEQSRQVIELARKFSKSLDDTMLTLNGQFSSIAEKLL